MAEPERKQLRPGLIARDVTTLGMATALVFALQIAMSGLANVEPVTLLILLYTLHFRKKALFVIYAFALLEGIWYGFHIWWVMYLYVWTVLWLVVTLLSRRGRRHGALFWAVVAGLYGLAFGFLCSFPYVALGGVKMAWSWWLAGLPFDAVHGGANFVLTLVLFTPLDRVMTMLRLGEAHP
ncbi:MAG: hypothetical protein LUG47_08780 [Clostridiales bacterium]|nr:hypothetical protein [Clostridiales bacterium]MCD7881732.1 hypothetical protein [Clostridiales bacterium]